MGAARLPLLQRSSAKPFPLQTRRRDAALGQLLVDLLAGLLPLKQVGAVLRHPVFVEVDFPVGVTEQQGGEFFCRMQRLELTFACGQPAFRFRPPGRQGRRRPSRQVRRP